MQNEYKNLLTEVSKYYSSKLIKYGETPLGVDWNGEKSQKLRFEQLSKIIKKSSPFTINDLGCGYGALCDYLFKKYENFKYTGFDVSENMICSAKQRYQDRDNVNFIEACMPEMLADYGVASGIFNVRFDTSDADWLAYIKSTLDVLNRTSMYGFSFNCLTSYSDQNKKKNTLYYADPKYLFDYCKIHYSRNITLLHDYDLYEFSILVRKNL
jgi:SAM-dependent methyltransferase